MKFALVTFGCKVNQYDTQLLRESLVAQGHSEVSPRNIADIYVVNTCAVTVHSERKARQQIHRIARKNPNARIFVVGCAVERDKEVWSDLPGVSAVAGANEALSLLGGTEGLAENVGISRFSGHTRAFLKVQEGCDSFCSYCIVPHVRGRSRSRAISEVVEEARRLVDNGHCEIVVSGIHVGMYGQDFDNRLTLVDLLQELNKIPELLRLRLSSIEMGEIDDELIRFAANSPKFCQHFHVPLQSGDDAVLRRMNRRYTADEFLSSIDGIRSMIDRPAITTDIMVGFPGETEEEFENTLSTCRAAKFSRTHIFPFSPRPGTPAATMPDQVDPTVIRERQQHLAKLTDTLALEFKQQFVGETLQVLVESRRDRESGLLVGYSGRYIRCLLEGPDSLMNGVSEATVREAHSDHVVAEIM